MVMQILKPIEITSLIIITFIGIIALIAELTEFEEIAKLVVIPSLVLLICVSIYAVFKTIYLKRLTV